MRKQYSDEMLQKENKISTLVQKGHNPRQYNGHNLHNSLHLTAQDYLWLRIDSF